MTDGITHISSARLSARLPRELLEELNALAASEDRTISQELRRAVRDHLDRTARRREKVGA
jgi:predicted DNA-binding protein